jgi:hypothetical protein
MKRKKRRRYQLDIPPCEDVLANLLPLVLASIVAELLLTHHPMTNS